MSHDGLLVEKAVPLVNVGVGFGLGVQHGYPRYLGRVLREM
jgi:hypothetical protein